MTKTYFMEHFRKASALSTQPQTVKVVSYLKAATFHNNVIVPYFFDCVLDHMKNSYNI